MKKDTCITKWSALLVRKSMVTTVVSLLTVAVCAVAHGEPARGSMRQGAKKVASQKATSAKRTTSTAKASRVSTPAKKKPAVSQQSAQAPAQTPFRRLPYVGAIAADAETGKVIFSDNADRKAYPASVTKLMTALLVLEDVEKGKYKLSDRAKASVRATHEQPSGVGIKPEQSMTIDDLLMALMVKSANDAAVVLAENAMDGDLLAFIARMNGRAAELGMKNTKYDSPNGLPPYDAKRRPKKWRHGYDYSTAADILKLSMEVVKHKQIFKYTSTKMATVTDGSGNPLKAVNHNNILVKDKQKILNEKGESEVDGLKTGYIDAGGSSIALTGTRNGRRAIVVVLGSFSTKDRDTNARSLMLRALNAVATAAKPDPAANVVSDKDSAKPPVPSAANVSDEAVSADPAKQQGESQSATAAPAETTGPARAEGGGGSLGWLLIFGAVGVAAAAFFAWRWIGKDSREEWNFEDVPSDDPGPTAAV